MSFLKKLKRMIIGESKPVASIKVVEVSPETKNRKQYSERPPRVSKNQNVSKNNNRNQDKNKEKRERDSYNVEYRGFETENSKNEKRGHSSNRRKRKGRHRCDESVSHINPDFIAETFSSWSADEFVVAEEAGKMRFHDLDIPASIMRGIFNAGYQYCTPIQKLIFPAAFKGVDVSGKAQTGTGKTAAFLITIFKRLLENSKEKREKGSPRVLIMSPTRELVIQIEKDARVLGKYTGLTIQSVFGGINYEKQRRQVEEKVIDILIATPGRLLDYEEQRVLNLSQVEILVIDEADRMLDMGFITDMKRIVSATPAKGTRQTMLFSATLTPEILKLASSWTKDALSFEVEAKELTAEAIEQRAYIVTDREKFPLIYNMITNENLSKVIIFGNRRSEVSRLADLFKVAGISCGVLSGDVSQTRRIRTLEDLRSGKIRVLCATDVAARGLHVSDISHVFNFSLPDDPEDYVHRIGRTGRAGASGVSILFATEEDAYVIPRIEQFTGHKLNYITPNEELVELSVDLNEKISARQISFVSGRQSSAYKGGGNFSGKRRSGRGELGSKQKAFIKK